MKKPALLILSLSALTMLASCSPVDGGASSSTPVESSSDSTTSSEEVIGTSKVKAVYNPISSSTLSVSVGDTVSSKGTITFVDQYSEGKDYQIFVNKTVATMTKSEDGKTYTYDYKVENNADMIVAITSKTETAEGGHKITFTQGEHYTIFGIDSGAAYSNEDLAVVFSVIPDSGYAVDSVSFKASGKAAMYLNGSNNVYSIYSNYKAFDSDGVISVDVTKCSTHTITYVGGDADNHFDATKSNLPTAFVGGDQVAFTFYALSGYAVTNVNVMYRLEGDEYDRYASTISQSKDYSSYVAIMPDADVTVDITTYATMALSLTNKERISNVGFYLDRDWDEDGNVTMTCPVTEAPLSGGSVYAAFAVESGYAPTGLVGFDSWDAYTCGRAADGRYIILFSVSDPETVLTVALEETNSVTIDGDWSKVDYSFKDGNTNGYLPNDTVYVNASVKEEYASEWSIKSIKVCYTDEYGDEEDDASYYDGQYTFSMVDGDVKLKVELYQPVKATMFYANKAGDLISGVSITGKTTEATLDDDNTVSSDFIEGEKVEISLPVGDDHSKSLKVSVIPASSSAEPESVYLSIRDRAYQGSFTVPEGGAVIAVEAIDDKTPLTVNYPDDGSVSFYKNADATSPLTSLTAYSNDVLYFTVDTTLGTDEVVIPSAVYDDDGYETELTVENVKIGDKDGFMVDLANAYSTATVFTIDYEVKKTYSFSAKTADGDDASVFFQDTDKYQALTFYNGKVAEGTNFTIGSPYSSFYKIEKVTIDGVEAEGVDTWNGTYYTVTGNVVVTVGLK